MTKVLVLAEHDNQNLKAASLHALTAALKLADSCEVLVVGSQCQSVAAQVATFAGVAQVIVCDHENYAHQLAENTAALVAQLAKGYTHLLATASTYSKNLLPRMAALCDVEMLSDVIEIVNDHQFMRPMYAGNVVATVESEDALKILSIRSTAFAKAEHGQGGAPIRAEGTVIENTTSSFVSQSLTPSERPELTSARIVISGGRGLKSAENFKLLEALADRLGAALGASRAAVDAGFAPNDYQVGQTGKVVAPDIYFAIGISGAIQHMAGMKDSKVVVAINNDVNAPIMQLADYCLVGDLFVILPELMAALN
jgi:electron transfer flavoprotein alpha subunit